MKPRFPPQNNGLVRPCANRGEPTKLIRVPVWVHREIMRRARELNTSAAEIIEMVFEHEAQAPE